MELQSDTSDIRAITVEGLTPGRGIRPHALSGFQEMGLLVVAQTDRSLGLIPRGAGPIKAEVLAEVQTCLRAFVGEGTENPEGRISVN